MVKEKPKSGKNININNIKRYTEKSTAKRKKLSVTMEEEIDEDKCVHDHIYLGISFNLEINGEYWKPGALMCGALCKNCNGNFYGKNKKCKISYKTSAMTCKGREKYG